MLVKSKVEISQNFVAFSEYMNFKIEKYRVPQSRESREQFGETETMKMAPRRDWSRGLESRLQALV